MTVSTTALQHALALLAPWSESVETPETGRRDVRVDARHLLPAVEALHLARWGYLSAITGLDHGAEAGDLEALYHFCAGPNVLTLRVPISRSEPSVPSICSLIPSASVHERELMEMFGIAVENIPDAGRLFLPDVWPQGIYPLRKDFAPAQLRETNGAPPRSAADEQSKTFIVAIGPQHPALKEPEHFAFTVEGEVVTHASVRLGYAHRGIEKATESRTWIQNLYLLERVCGICSHVHALAYALGVEKLAGVSAPPRAQAIRTLVAALERFHSHLLWFGVAAHEAGFDTLFMYSWRDREPIMDLLDEITGQRVNYSANVLGGVKYDITPMQAKTVRRTLDQLDSRLWHYLDVVTHDAAFLQRTRGIGVIDREQAERLGTLGPTARASGVARDVRVDAPYAAYADFPVHMVTASAGDLEARFVVRIQELIECSQMIRTLLDGMPAGELTARMPRRIPAGEAVSRVEAPRGELFYFIQSGGGDGPARVKIRTPTLCNLASVLVLAVGSQLADVPMILVGVDPCFSCNDRCAVVRSPTGDRRLLSWRQLGQSRREEEP